jgi:hypothetical protein
MTLAEGLPGATRDVRVIRTADGVELYFPALRAPEVAVPLAVFGVIAAAIPAVAIIALVPAAVSSASTLLSAALLAGFALPFVAFGGIFLAVAIYMMANALHVRVSASTIDTARLVFGVVVKRRRLGRDEIVAVQPEIPARYQSLFSSLPSYQLVARDRHARRVVVAETLRGVAVMERVKALIENPAVPVIEGTPTS